MRTNETSESPVAITARQLEALVRLSEARAKASCNKEVTIEDAQAAILLMQKSLRQVGIDVSTGKMDIDILMTGTPKSVRDRLQLILATIVEAEKIEEMIQDEDLYQKLQEKYGLARVETSRLLEQLVRDGLIYSPKRGYYKKT